MYVIVLPETPDFNYSLSFSQETLEISGKAPSF